MKKLAERLAFLLLNGGKACFYNGEKQKRKVATLEQAGFLIVLKHTPTRVHAFNVASLC